MIRTLMVCALMAQPVAAECFVGQPHKVTYAGGSVLTILDRQGDVETHQWSSANGDSPVVTYHLHLIPLESREGGTIRRDKWKGRLPRLADLVPGYEYDISGTSVSRSGAKETLRVAGKVLPKETVMVGNCGYETTVIDHDFYLNGEWLWHETAYLRTDMLVKLKADSYFDNGGSASIVATAIE